MAESHAHVPMTRDEIQVAIAAAERYAADMVRSAGATSSSAAVAREVARRLRIALRDLG